MPANDLTERILQKDWSILGPPPPTSLSAGRDAAEQVGSLAKHPDREVRELALNVLGALGGPVAHAVFLAALNDSDEIVRARACNLLHAHRDPADRPVLEKELKENPDEYVREHAALILGEMGDLAAVPALRDRKKIELDEHARWGMTLALARLKDHDAVAAVEQALHQEQASKRAEALEDFRYVGDPRLVRGVVLLLADERDAVNVGGSHAPWYIRVCDVAVNALDAVLNHPFSFKVERGQRYTSQELKDAAEIARSKASIARPAAQPGV